VLAGGVASACSETVSYANSRTHAVYAQGTYDLSDFLDGLSLTGGVRYTWDKTYGTVNQFSGTPQTATAPAVIGPALISWGQTETSHAPSYTISVDWQLDPKTLVYFTNSEGYSRGGVTLIGTLPAAARNYNPESLNDLEIGIKADWDLPWDMKARTNIAYFYGFYDNIQVPAQAAILDVFGNVATVTTTTNAANGHVSGVDFDLTLLPTDDIQLSFGGVESTDDYDNYPYCTSFGAGGRCLNVVSYIQQPFVVAPRWTWHGRAAYTLPIDEALGKVTLAANVSHISAYYGSGFNYPTPGWPGSPIQNTSVNTYDVDMALNWTSFLGRAGLDARAYVNNLMNDHWGQGAIPTYTAPGVNSQPVARPRSWGVGMRYAFGP
jgi:iron complex outermembrane receptor protein